MRSTYSLKASDIKRKWYVVDATGHTLGRLSSEIAKVLSGKNKPNYGPNLDNGDYVIVVNADKLQIAEKKLNQKVYRHHSGYPGGLKTTTMKVMMQKKPCFILEHAIKGMLPKNNMGRQMYKKLFVYDTPDHEHAAQKPEVLEIKY